MMSGHSWKIAAPLAVACCLLSACGTPKSGGINPDQRLHVAKAAEASGDTILARTMYAAAASEALDNRNIQIEASEGLSRTGSPADAMVLLNAVLQRSPDDVDVRIMLGSLQIVNGRPDEAVQNLSKAYAAKPDDDKIRINLGVALDMTRRHAEAQKLYWQVLAKSPKDIDASNDLALSLVLSGQVAAAKNVLLPFRGRPDLPERMQMTMQMADSAPQNSGTVSPAPTPLNSKSSNTVAAKGASAQGSRKPKPRQPQAE
jgi:Flp pilus assembly protein TadD